jgi:hypothetical protein
MFMSSSRFSSIYGSFTVSEKERLAWMEASANVLSSTAPVTSVVLLYRAAFNAFNILLSILAISIATGDEDTFSTMVMMVLIIYPLV